MWWLASILSAGAGSIHIALGLAHAEGSRIHQFFFLGVGAFQVGWSSIAWPDGPGDRLRRAAVALNLGILTVYAFSRVVGIPPGEVFDPGRADVIAAGFEIALVVVLVRRVDLAVPRPMAALSTVVILALMVIGVLAGFDGLGHFGPGGQHLH